MQDPCKWHRAVAYIYRTALFERCLAKLSKRGGTATEAAKKAEEFISSIMSGGASHGRKKFSYTWNGEYRIKHCKKINLVGAYRLVFIEKDGGYVLLYAGSHDDCFRWIERNKGLTCEVDHPSNAVRTSGGSTKQGDSLPEGVLEEREFVKRYEEEFMSRVDENMLLRVFSGWSRESEE